MKKYIITILVLFISVYAADRGDFCGTVKALEDYHRGKLPQRPTLSGPVLFIENSLFRVHYTLQGTDATSLAYAETTFNALAKSWAKLCDTLGWVVPPPDNNIGGDNRFDVYIRVLPSGIAGVTHPENSYPTPYPDGVSSHFQIDKNLDFGYLKSTVCHEFHHSIQFRYSSQEGGWWMENCATWSEDIVYDELNDYLGFLSSAPGPFNNPEYPINSFSGTYQYGGCSWAFFLIENYGSNSVRQMWEYQGQINSENTLQGIDHILSTQYSSNIITALKKYSVWRYFTGSRADTVHYYKEGHLWPMVRTTNSHTSYPVSGDQGSYPIRNPGGTGYIHFMNGGGRIAIAFNAQSVYRWGCNVIAYRSNNLSQVYELMLNSAGNGSDSFAWGEYEHFALIPVALQWEWNTGPLPFNYTANLTINHDVGVVRITGMSSLVDSGAIVNPIITIKNFGSFAENFPVRFTIGNNYINNQNISLAPGDSSIINFPTCTLNTRGYNAYKCTTMLNGDERVTNNSLSDRVFVRVKDIGVLSIIAPTGNVVIGSAIYPQARIKNYGNLRENLSVDFAIGDWIITKATSLSAGLEYDLVFDSVWIPLNTGFYTVKCSTKLTNDINPLNNRVISSCNVISSDISETKSSGNIQFPFITINNQKIKLNNNINWNDIKLRVFDIKGKLIYEGNSVQISDLKVASGCYILSVLSNNQMSNYKAVIINN